ncbi:NUDIX hydrolase [Fusibacter sp. 3D3]|uniref:NUDIX hydrolase n=1 Tax=Fusibacter sp. 3D3 TaxID=1048380 RepID=UPI0008537CD2|nr:NUDIX hydrolase [Fusibacter sp. 3D3]GAU78053.1 AP4A hydrolase [Fusibacter sp. 3D3]
MKKVFSAGGVVFLKNSVLMLQKINGDWVLPKGKIEDHETSEDTAMREVREEAGIKTKIISPIGETSYKFKNYWSNNHVIEKNVVWYLMKALSSSPHPQREEGFIDSKFIHVNNVVQLAKYDDERDILMKALEIIQAIEGA